MVANMMPPVCLKPAEHHELMQLALLADLDDHPEAEFLASELQRARIERNPDSDVVSLGKCVTFRIGDNAPMTRILVHPADFVRIDTQVSVLSAVGVAILGLRSGDRMPFADANGDTTFVTVIQVKDAPGVVDYSLLRRLRRPAADEPDDPGPTAA